MPGSVDFSQLNGKRQIFATIHKTNGWQSIRNCRSFKQIYHISKVCQFIFISVKFINFFLISSKKNWTLLKKTTLVWYSSFNMFQLDNFRLQSTKNFIRHLDYVTYHIWSSFILIQDGDNPPTMFLSCNFYKRWN